MLFYFQVSCRNVNQITSFQCNEGKTLVATGPFVNILSTREMWLKVLSNCSLVYLYFVDSIAGPELSYCIRLKFIWEVM